MNFIDSISLPTHLCHNSNCQKIFKSRNKLFRHLREQCWKRSSDALLATLADDPDDSATPRIIESVARDLPKQDLGTAFRGYQHTKADVRFSPEGENHEICLDLGCLIILGDRALLASSIPDFEVRIH